MQPFRRPWSKRASERPEARAAVVVWVPVRVAPGEERVMEELLGSEGGLALLATVMGVVWAFLRGTEIYQKIANTKLAVALAAVEAGVAQVWAVYTSAIKQGRADGTLTPEERAEARRLAREAAVAFGRTRGVDVVRELGAAGVDMMIEQSLATMKGKGMAR